MNTAAAEFVDEVKKLNNELKTKTMDFIKEVGNEFDIFSTNLKTAAIIEQEAFEKFIETADLES